LLLTSDDVATKYQLTHDARLLRPMSLIWLISVNHWIRFSRRRLRPVPQKVSSATGGMG
jgi:hypothetical protein